MKIYIHVLLLTLLAACSSNNYQEKSQPNATAKHIRTEISGGKFIFYGNVMPNKPELGDFEAILGKASRVLPKANILHVYDSEGIVIYQDPNSSRITSVKYFLGKRDFDFTPEKTYEGLISFYGKPVLKNSSIESIKSRFKEMKFEQVLTLSWYKAQIGNISIHISYNNDNEIGELTIGIENY